MAHIQKIEHKKPQSLVGRLPGLWLLRFYLEEHRFKYTSESLLWIIAIFAWSVSLEAFLANLQISLCKGFVWSNSGK